MSEVGVVIGRFQVDAPHPGHRNLIEEVHKRHGKVLIMLGCAPVKFSDGDPMDYPTRVRMMQNEFPWATIVPIDDQSSDKEWSKNVDRILDKIFPTDKAVLYGSRKSFAKSYSGKWKIVELESLDVPSGTELRKKIANEVKDSADFRAGIIYACSNKFPISYQTVDVAVLSTNYRTIPLEEIEILLCRKQGEEKLRFIGGFVSPDDLCLEMTCRREVNEEAQIEISEPEYVGSFRVDDWRYRGRDDKILTALFTASYVFGHIAADDDVVEVLWAQLEFLTDRLVDEHKELGAKLMAYLKAKKQKGEIK